MVRRILIVFANILLGMDTVKGEAQPEDLSQIRITSIWQQGDQLIASTNKNGFYRASQTEKIWRKMDTPPSMASNGKLALGKGSSPKLLFYTGTPLEYEHNSENAAGSLFISKDSGNTWTESTLKQVVLNAFAHPNGSLFVITETTNPNPPSSGNGPYIETNGAKTYLSKHLLQSKDDGRTWKEITPSLKEAFGMYSVFQDPDHSDLICVFCGTTNPLSKTSVFQAQNSNYNWQETLLEKWHSGTEQEPNYWVLYGGGTNDANMPATLESYFKFAYGPEGLLNIATKYLAPEKTFYVFHLNQTMPVSVQTVFMYPDKALEWLDNVDETVFWALKLESDVTGHFFTRPRTEELSKEGPDRERKISTYLNNSNLTKIQVSQTHPYQRTVDLNKFYHFTVPGNYRVQLLYSDLCLVKSGTAFQTPVINISVIP